MPSQVLAESKYWRLRMQRYLQDRDRMLEVDEIEAANARD